MARLLHIETTTNTTSIALSENGSLLALAERFERNLHASIITLLIEEVMKSGRCTYADLHGISVSMGPGSYTGLRIGVATAKGLCYATDLPLIGLNTLEVMFRGLMKLRFPHIPREMRHVDKREQWGREQAEATHLVHPKESTAQIISHIEPWSDDTLFCPMIDARRMEVYMRLFDLSGQEILDTRAEIINEHLFRSYLDERPIVFFGEGIDKIKQFYSQPNAIFVDPFYNSAAYQIELAEQRYQEGHFENIAYFEPFYLKEFIGTQKKTEPESSQPNT